MPSIEELGWRQCSVLKIEDWRTVVDHKCADSDLPIVLTQDCDLVCLSFEVEPCCEVLVASAIDGPTNGNNTYGKNPRSLHFDRDGRAYEANIRNRVSIDRRRLESFSPDENGLPDKLRQLIPDWCARRYARDAFPTAFNTRLECASERLRRVLKSKGRNLTAVFMMVETDELDQEHDYGIDVIGTYEVDATPEDRREMQGCLDAFCKVLSTCPGIVLLNHELRSEAQVSLDDIRHLLRWDCDDMSIRSDPPDPRIRI